LTKSEPSLRPHDRTRRELLCDLVAAGGLVAISSPAALLSGCGVRPGTPPSGYPRVNRDLFGNKIPVRLLLAPDYARAAPLRGLVKDFTVVYPNIDVDVWAAPWDDIPNRVKAAAAAGTPYDVAQHHALIFGRLGLAENLDDLWAAWGRQGDYLPNAIDAVTWSGKKYGVPLDVSCLFCIYNPDLFAAAGATPPAEGMTYPQLREQLLKFAGQPVKAVGLSLTPWMNYGIVRANGGDLLNPTENGPTLNAAGNVAALRWISELGWRYKVGSDPAAAAPQDQPVVLFTAKKLALLFGGPWDLPALRRSGVRFATAELPKGMDGTTAGSVLGGSSLFIGKGSRSWAAAFEFLKWSAAAPFQARMTQELGFWPPLASTYADRALTEDPILKPFFSQLRVAKAYRVEAFPDWDQAWTEALTAAYGGTDAQKALDEAQAKVVKTLP